MSKQSTKQRSESQVVDVRVMKFDSVYENGSKCVYPRSIGEKIILDIAGGKKFSIEEVSPVERNLKRIPPFQSWPEHAMAESVGARIDGDVLVMSFRIRKNKYGKLLSDAIATHGLDKLYFFPVGIGEDKDGVVTKYELSYISFEVKKG